MQRKVGNGAIWGVDRNVVMAWGKVGSQQHDHDAVACRASHFIELPCQTSFCLFLHFFISLLSVA